MHEGSDPIAIAAALRVAFGFGDLYIADLDAIAGAEPATAILGPIAALGFHLWVDAGIRDEADVARLLAIGVATVVVGLETVRGPRALERIAATIEPTRLIFSLDLRDGRPLIDTGPAWGVRRPEEIAAAALGLGMRRLLLLDLARVGTGQGTGTLDLLTRIRGWAPSETEVSVGGGVAGVADVERLAAAGASSVLVGSALHDGRIGASGPARLVSRPNPQ